MKILIDLTQDLRKEAASFEKPEEPPFTGGSKPVHVPPRFTKIPSAPKRVKETVKQPQTAPRVPDILKETQSSQDRAAANDRTPRRVAEENMKGLKEFRKNLEEGLNKTYVIGGSPIGWNFLFYPGGEAVYYGVKKDRLLSLRVAK